MRARRNAIAALLATAAAVAWPAGAGAATAVPVSDSSPASTFPPSQPFRDRVVHSPPRAARARVAAAAARVYYTSDGIGVLVEVSSSFPDDANTRSVAQSFVNLLGSHIHGRELARLRLFIGTRQEIQNACGGGSEVLACYSDFEGRMYVPGDRPRSNGPYTTEYALTHEYGHHIARFRRNDPLSSAAYGPKYWSSYKHTCDRVQRRILFVNAQTADRYLKDTGEGWAESYAHLHYPNVPWFFSSLMRPDAGAFAAVRRDVLQPWSGQRVRTFRGSLGGDRRATSTVLRVTLDGTLDLKLNGPGGADFQVDVVKGSRLLRRTRALGSQDSVAGLYCRNAGESAATLRLRVRRLTGSGSFALRISYPG